METSEIDPPHYYYGRESNSQKKCPWLKKNEAFSAGPGFFRKMGVCGVRDPIQFPRIQSSVKKRVYEPFGFFEYVFIHISTHRINIDGNTSETISRFD